MLFIEGKMKFLTVNLVQFWILILRCISSLLLFWTPRIRHKFSAYKFLYFFKMWIRSFRTVELNSFMFLMIKMIGWSLPIPFRSKIYFTPRKVSLPSIGLYSVYASTPSGSISSRSLYWYWRILASLRVTALGVVLTGAAAVLMLWWSVPLVCPRVLSIFWLGSG